MIAVSRLACRVLCAVAMLGTLGFAGAAPASGAHPAAAAATAAGGPARCAPCAVGGMLAPLGVHAATRAGASMAAALPDEQLVRDATTHRISLVWAGIQHRLNSSATLAALGLSDRPITLLTDAEAAAIPEGEALRLRLAHGLVYPLSPIASGHARLSLSAPSAAPGAGLTIEGRAFAPAETVQIAHGGLTSTLQAGPAGTFSLGLTVPSGTVVGSVLRVHAYGLTSHTFEVEPISVVAAGPAPALTAQPAAPAPGTALQVNGSGFAPSERVDLFLAQGVSALEVMADGSGSFAGVQMAIPTTLSARRHSLIAFGLSSRLLAETSVAVGGAGARLAGISVNRYTVPPGGLAVVGLTGFAPGELVKISFAGRQVFALPVDATGSLRDAGFAVPASIANGAYPLEAIGTASGREARTSLTVSAIVPRIAVTPATQIAPGTPLQVRGSGFAAGEAVTIALNSAAVRTDPAQVLTSAGGTFEATIIPLAATLAGTNTVAATGAASRSTAIATVTAAIAASAVWYLAGGDTHAGSHTAIALVNPDTQPATVAVTLAGTDGPTIPYRTTMPAGSRTTIDVNTIAGSGRYVFATVQADRAIGAQETVYRDGGDFRTAIGVRAALTTWYLAEGYTGLTFREHIHLYNPGAAPAQVDVQLLPFNGRRPVTVQRTVPAGHGAVLDINAGLPGQSVAAIVHSDRAIVADRVLTFGAGGYGATEQAGAGAPATTWLFAEGSSLHGFETYLTVLNPSLSQRARVTATFFDRSGAALGNATVVIEPRHRGNIRVNDVVRASGIATILSSTVPVVAERPLYFGAPNAGRAAGSDVLGRNGGGLRWLFPEGGSVPDGREFLLLQNPSGQAATVHVQFFGEAGPLATRDVQLPPRSRVTLDVRRDVASLPAGPHSSLLTSTNGVPVIAEQSLYGGDLTIGDSTAGIAG